MTVTVDIKTGDRSILSYLLKPIIKTVSGSLGER
jgi:adhesin transport system membrane fusion protein